MANNFNNKLEQSTNPLAFTTNGQNRNNSLPTVIRSNESSLRVEYASTNKDATSYLTYACNFTQPSTGTHNLKWTFTPNHNTKGYIKNDGIKINILGRMPSTTIDIDEVEKYGNYDKFGLEEGKGTSASNPMPVEGGIIAFNVSGVSYDCARGCNTNRLVTATRYYKFPANSSLDEDGTGNKEIEVVSNIGQRYTNTYSPNISLIVRTSYTYIHTYGISRNYRGTKDTNVLNMIVTGPIDYSPYDETILKHLSYNGTNYAYIDSNLGSVKKGTCSGIYTAYATNVRPQANSSSRIVCNTQNLTITQSDNSQAKTNPRRVNLMFSSINGDATRDKYKFASFDKQKPEEPYDTVTIYQDGGNLATPNPSTSISWEWVGDSAINARNWGSVVEFRPKTKIINGVSCETEYIFDYYWKSNTGTNAVVGGTLTSAPSKQTQAENNITTGNNCYYINCPDNTGSEITIELDGHFMAPPRDTSSRSLSGKFLITCENDEQGSIGSLSNEIDFTDIFNLKRKVPFTITQEGKTNPEPSFIIQQKLVYYFTNPDTSVMPTITFNSGQEKAGQSLQKHTITTTGTQTILLTIPNTRPSVQGATVDYKSSTITNSAALKTIPASGGTVDLNVDWNYTINDFNSGYVPGSGEYKWYTYFPEINTSTNVDGTVTNDTVTFYINQPGNGTIETGNYKTVTISINGVEGKNGQQPWGSLSVRTNNNIITSTNSLSCTRSSNSLITANRKFVFNAKSNNASISKVSAIYDKNTKLLTVTHNGVSTTNKQGYCNFVKSEGGLQYAGQTENITNYLKLLYNVAGETYGGKITLSVSKASGSGDCGNVRVANHIDLTTVPTSGKRFSMSDLVLITGGSGNYDSSVFKLPNSVTVPADSTYYGIVCPAATVTSSTSSTWNVYGKITGTVNSSLNNTSPIGLRNGFIRRVSTPIVTPTVPNNYYFWWDPTSNDNKTSMTSNKNVATIYCQTNTGGSGYVATKTEYFGNGYWVKVTGGKENKTDSRKLGTLRAGFGTTKANATSSVDVWQAGTGGGNIANSGTFTFNLYNCDGFIGSTPAHNTSITTTLSSSSSDDPQSVNGHVNSINWNKWSNNTSELSLVIYNLSYIGSGASIGAFDSNINTNIGISVSKVNIRFPYKVICNGHELSSYSESGGEVSPTYKVTWSDGVTTGLTRNISIAATSPGTYTYSVTKLVVSYTFTNAWSGNSATVTKEQSLDKSWTFTVDSKHYYNS